MQGHTAGYVWVRRGTESWKGGPRHHIRAGNGEPLKVLGRQKNEMRKNKKGEVETMGGGDQGGFIIS